MPEIKPFRALRYDPARVKLSEVVAPPYDVISKERRSELYDLNPYNVVRLILGREKDPYASAARAYEEWKLEGIVAREEEPAIYLLKQEFQSGATSTFTRRGFIAACRLEEFGKGSIYPHELTLSGPKEDRLRLLESVHAMFSQIFALYSDPKHELDRHFDEEMRKPPVASAEFDGVRNSLWVARENGLVLALAGFLKGQRVLVADGHHRYETALNYSHSLRLKNPGHSGTEPYNFVPMYFTNMNDPALVILPTHRVVHGVGDFNTDDFLEKLKAYFNVEPEDSLEELAQSLSRKREGAFGLIVQGTPGFALLSYKKQGVPGMADAPALLARLDVSILHSVVMEKILGITKEEQEKKIHLNYEQDPGQAVRLVRQGKAQAAFLLNPTRIEQLRAIAEAGFTMPQKSTYFYPKLLSGLVTYSFLEA